MVPGGLHALLLRMSRFAGSGVDVVTMPGSLRLALVWQIDWQRLTSLQQVPYFLAIFFPAFQCMGSKLVLSHHVG